jgi:serine/threonine protein phosphatase PrpC
MRTNEGKAKLLSYREGNTNEEKRRPRFMEEENYIGTAECMGCTACSVIIYKDKVYTGNLGDSRAVMGVESGKKTVPDDEKSPKV